MQISIPPIQVRGALSGGWNAYVRFIHHKIQIRGMKMKISKKGINLTEGPIAKQIILFAVPLFLSSLIQQLYNTVDLIFFG